MSPLRQCQSVVHHAASTEKEDKQAVPSPGMNTMVTIECSEGDVRNLSVPGGAILRENGRTSIFLYDASSHAIRRCDVTVTRLLSDGRCLITSDGANPVIWLSLRGCIM